MIAPPGGPPRGELWGASLATNAACLPPMGIENIAGVSASGPRSGCGRENGTELPTRHMMLFSAPSPITRQHGDLGRARRTRRGPRSAADGPRRWRSQSASAIPSSVPISRRRFGGGTAAPTSRTRIRISSGRPDGPIGGRFATARLGSLFFLHPPLRARGLLDPGRGPRLRLRLRR